jgi:hypothetical protein
MFRLGRLKAPRKVHADSCLHSQPFNENFTAIEANLTRQSLSSQHTCKSLKTIRDGTRHSTVKMHPSASGAHDAASAGQGCLLTGSAGKPTGEKGNLAPSFRGSELQLRHSSAHKRRTTRGEPSASFSLSCGSSRALKSRMLACFSYRGPHRTAAPRAVGRIASLFSSRLKPRPARLSLRKFLSRLAACHPPLPSGSPRQ